MFETIALCICVLNYIEEKSYKQKIHAHDHFICIYVLPFILFFISSRGFGLLSSVLSCQPRGLYFVFPIGNVYY